MLKQKKSLMHSTNFVALCSSPAVVVFDSQFISGMLKSNCMSLHKWYTINRLLIALYQMIGDMQIKLWFLRKGRNMMQRVIDQRRLLTSVAQTLEHIIGSNINKHLAFEKNLADCQHGLRSPTEVLQNLNGSVLPWRGRGVNCCNRQTDVIIMDFAKAFDKVAHGGQ